MALTLSAILLLNGLFFFAARSRRHPARRPLSVLPQVGESYGEGLMEGGEAVGVHRLFRRGGAAGVRSASDVAAVGDQGRKRAGASPGASVEKGERAGLGPASAGAKEGDTALRRRDGEGGYNSWRSEASRLASLPPSETLSELSDHDPFGVRAFGKALKEQETALGRVLTQSEIRSMFPCPSPSERITLPDRRDHTKARAFREEEAGTFLFFQHLRKAGGTNFCSLAEANLPKKARPGYYCMPDWKWSGRKTAGYLHHYSNDELERRMREDGFRIAGNEWDDLDPSRHFDLPAVFATSFRSPLDRALSQFRFECVEDRGCKIKDIETFWRKRWDLHNVYSLTFADPPQGGGNRQKLLQAFGGTTPEDRRKRAELLEAAMDSVARFHLVLDMEWLAYASPLVESVLGFADTSALTKRVRPHIGQAKRDDGQEQNKLGSAGIAKASWDPGEYLSSEQYKIMSEDLALDEVLTDVARRMFLERLVCNDQLS